MRRTQAAQPALQTPDNQHHAGVLYGVCSVRIRSGRGTRSAWASHAPVACSQHVGCLRTAGVPGFPMGKDTWSGRLPTASAWTSMPKQESRRNAACMRRAAFRRDGSVQDIRLAAGVRRSYAPGHWYFSVFPGTESDGGTASLETARRRLGLLLITKRSSAPLRMSS